MKKVAPELESLMWTLAEEDNERAIDEFGERHPELRAELLHRINMVKGLRGAKKKPVETPRPIPKFVPKEPRSSGPVYLVGALVLCAVCALAFTATILVTPPPHPASVRSVQTTPPSPIVRQGLERQPTQETAPRLQAQQPPPADDVDKALRPGTLKIEHAPLLTVLQMMGDSCGIEIDAAPGMPNPEVTVDYRDMTAMDMLRDLGRQFGFTPLDQYNGSILVIPAVDKGNSGTGGSGANLPQERVGG